MTDNDCEVVVYHQLNVLPVQADKIKNDLILQEVCKYLMNGWPKKTPTEMLAAFCNRKVNISYVSNFI